MLLIRWRRPDEGEEKYVENVVRKSWAGETPNTGKEMKMYHSDGYVSYWMQQWHNPKMSIWS